MNRVRNSKLKDFAHLLLDVDQQFDKTLETGINN